MKRSRGRRPESGQPHASHRRPKARLSRPRLTFRLVTAGVFAALLGGGIAYGAGAVQMPPSARTAKSTPATTAAAPAEAEAAAAAATMSTASPEGFAIATLPRTPAAHASKASHSPTRNAVTTPAASATVTPVQPAYSPQPASTPATTPSSQSASSSGLTPQPTAEYQTPTGQDQLAWSEAILDALGDPLTSTNIVSIGYWMQNEAGKPPYGIVGANNPINVSEPGYGGTQIQYEAPGYYLMSYPSVQEGVKAIAAYLNNGSYPQILNDLKQGAGLMSDSSLASELNEYSGGGYSAIPDSWGASQGKPES